MGKNYQIFIITYLKYKLYIYIHTYIHKYISIIQVSVSLEDDISTHLIILNYTHIFYNTEYSFRVNDIFTKNQRLIESLS